MSAPPSFSSFPEIEQPKASTSKLPPTFSSFPEVEQQEARRKDRSRSPDRRRRGRGEEPSKSRGGDRERRHRSREREREKERAKGRSKREDRDADGKDDMRRREKEERRRREREKADELVRGEKKSARAKETENVEKREVKQIYDEVEDGTAWYESSKRVVKKGYEEPFQPEFFEDKVGDSDVKRYGIASAKSVPRYHRNGQGRILGLSAGIRVVNNKKKTERGLEVAPLGRPSIPRYSSKTLDGAVANLKRILLRPANDVEADHDLDLDFLKFTIPSARPLRSTEDLPSYRDVSIPQPEPEDEDEIDIIPESLGTLTTLEQELQTRKTEAERYAKANPTDIDAWITLCKLHTDTGDGGSVKANAEITLSILSKAFKADSRNDDSAKLHRAYLRAAEGFLPPQKVDQRWKNVLEEFNGDDKMSLWWGYLEWKEGEGFSDVDQVVDDYLQCLRELRKGRKEDDMVVLFVKICCFLREAGYTERALATFQALIELTFFKPDHLRPHPSFATDPVYFQGLLDDFEAFWDSEFPRVGEHGAAGWKSWYSSSATNAAEPASSSRALEGFTHTSENPFERWREAERYQETNYSLPARATDLDVSDDDPFRVVLFSDIQDFLFPIAEEETKSRLIHEFLCFLGLPNSDGTACHKNTSGFWPIKATKRITYQTVGGEPMEPEYLRSIRDPFGCPVKAFKGGRSERFGREGRWFREVDKRDLEGCDVGFMRNVFALFRSIKSNDELILLEFSFESAVSPKSAIKLAKSILAVERDNLLLWDVYARLERQRGSIAAARAVYMASLKGSEAEGTLALWAAWAEMEWEEGEADRCLQVLVMAAGVNRDFGELALSAPLGLVLTRFSAEETKEPARPAAILMLKSKQYYLALHRPYNWEQLLLLTLFTYYTTDITGTIDFLASLPPAERSQQLLAKVIYLHTNRNPSPASLSRDILEGSIAQYPTNTIFLSLHLYGELGNRVFGRIQKTIAKLQAPTGILWGVWAEGVLASRTFWDEDGNGAERVRSVLDRGIKDERGKRESLIWKLFIEFEVLMKRYSSAKALLYRAVMSIGGCKDLYLLPLESNLRPHFSNKELRDWSELMLERGIRLRVPFEEFWISQEQEDEERLRLDKLDEEEEEEAGGDELTFLREREERKPY
ncbi:nuclear exosome regulator NRDE2, partial [Tremellales sp. Uapishka_1]